MTRVRGLMPLEVLEPEALGSGGLLDLGSEVARAAPSTSAARARVVAGRASGWSIRTDGATASGPSASTAASTAAVRPDDHGGLRQQLGHVACPLALRRRRLRLVEPAEPRPAPSLVDVDGTRARAAGGRCRRRAAGRTCVQRSGEHAGIAEVVQRRTGSRGRLVTRKAEPRSVVPMRTRVRRAHPGPGRRGRARAPRARCGA